MKKIIIAVCAMLIAFTVIPVMGQTQLGVIAGLNLANVSVEQKGEGEEYKNLTAFAFGGVASFGLSEMMMIQLEPTYMQKGTKATSELGEFKLKLAYIDIPVLLKIAFGQSNVKPYALVGGNIGFLMSAKVSNGESVDVKDSFESLDYGLNFGAGVSIPAGSNQFFIEGQYGLGLADITKDEDGESTSDKNKGIQIKAGILFPLGQ